MPVGVVCMHACVCAKLLVSVTLQTIAHHILSGSESLGSRWGDVGRRFKWKEGQGWTLRNSHLYKSAWGSCWPRATYQVEKKTVWFSEGQEGLFKTGEIWSSEWMKWKAKCKTGHMDTSSWEDEKKKLHDFYVHKNVCKNLAFVRASLWRKAL